MKKYISLFTCCLLYGTSALAQVISGRFEGQSVTDQVYLYHYSDLMGYDEHKIIDSAKIVNGRFHFDYVQGKEPGYAQLVQQKRREGKKGWDYFGTIELFLANDTISVVARDSLANALVYNSGINYDYQVLQKLIEPIQTRLLGMEHKIGADYKAAPAAIRQSKEYQRYHLKWRQLAYKELSAAYDSFIQSFPNSWISLYAMQKRIGIGHTYTPQQLLQLYSNLNSRLKTSDRGKDFKKRIERLISLQPGTDAPVFSIPNAKGEQVSLAAYRGKYVLLEFWTISCSPCRAEAPHLQEVYKKYHNRGFDILSVSLDDARYTKKDSWLDAIKHDGTDLWQQVSDFKGGKSPIAIAYEVYAIPQNFLIDPEGKIVTENLRGADLKEKLQELYGF